MANFGESATDRLFREFREQERQRELLKAAGRGGYPESSTDRLLRELHEQEKQRDLLKAAGYTDELRRLQDREAEMSHPFKALGLADEINSLQARVAEVTRPFGVGNMAAPSGPARVSQDIALRSAPPRALPSRRPVTTTGDIGALVRAARKRARMNQSTFAALAGVGRRFLSELEGGKPSLEFDKVMACAAAAGIDLLARPRDGS